VVKPLIITLGSFQIFSKIRGDIRKSRCTTGVNDTGGKFTTGVNDTGGELEGKNLYVNMFTLPPKGDKTKLLKFF
jgi:hypothetical protein